MRKHGRLVKTAARTQYTQGVGGQGQAVLTMRKSFYIVATPAAGVRKSVWVREGF